MENLSEKLTDQLLNYREVIKNAEVLDQIKANGIKMKPSRVNFYQREKKNLRKWRAKVR
ncbi:hypothetical protein [Vagococcus sp.]|uniref:hypothetical protein n=1 Tax=Vagococcus sp. TaxID=1933889 RepID=UPI003F9CDF8F